MRSQLDLLVDLRELVGKPGPNQVNNRTLNRHLTAALRYLAERLQYRVQSDPVMLPLTAGQYVYSLPEDLLHVLTVDWNTEPLDPQTIWGWDRQKKNYRHSTASTPTEYALQGRNLYLYPAPSADALVTDPNLSLQFIRTFPGLDPGGAAGLTDNDCDVALYRAAIRYLSAKTPGDEKEQAADDRKILRYTALLREIEPLAVARTRQPRNRQPSLNLVITRDSAAR